MADAATLQAERAARAAARRARLTAHVSKIDHEPRATLEGTPESRIELVVELTRAAWALSGQAWPQLPRSQWPMRVRKLGEAA